MVAVVFWSASESYREYKPDHHSLALSMTKYLQDKAKYSSDKVAMARKVLAAGSGTRMQINVTFALHHLVESKSQTLLVGVSVFYWPYLLLPGL